MKTAFAFLALLGVSTAFMPTAPRMSRGRSVRMAVNEMIGSDVETGGVFDPLGLAKDEASLYRSRLIELKHGRVAMLACLGTLVQSFYHLPDEVFANPRPLAALAQVFNDRPVAFWQIFLTLGAIELTIGKQDTANRAPGDVGFGAAFIPDDADDFAALQLKELKNGRLAMLAIIGQFVQEKLTGQGPIEQLLEGHFSPFGDGQGMF